MNNKNFLVVVVAVLMFLGIFVFIVAGLTFKKYGEIGPMLLMYALSALILGGGIGILMKIISEPRYLFGDYVGIGSIKKSDLPQITSEDLEEEILNETYKFFGFFENLEDAKIIRGNGHHIAQHLAQYAAKEFNSHLIKKRKKEE